MFPSRQKFDLEIRRLTGEHPDARPFLCHGSPNPCDVMLVGLNPGVAVPFWQHWDVTNGCDKAGWLDAYRHLHQRYGPTRKRIELLFEALSNYRCVEANLYPIPSKRLSNLPRELRSLALFEYLLEVLRPRLLFVHGADAVAYLRSRAAVELALDRPMLMTVGNWSGTAYATRHLSYHWRDADVVTLGSTLGSMLSRNSGPSNCKAEEVIKQALTTKRNTGTESLMKTKTAKGPVEFMNSHGQRRSDASPVVSNRNAIANARLDEEEVLDRYARLIRAWRTAMGELPTQIERLTQALAAIHEISTNARSRASAVAALGRIAKIAGESISAPVANVDSTPPRAERRKAKREGLMVCKPSAALAAIVGPTPLSRTEVTKRLWEYIKKRNLQDAENPRRIHTDARLQKILGDKPTVSVSEMTRLVSSQLK